MPRRAWLLALVVVQLSCARPGSVAPGLVDLQLLAFNDFHGTLEPGAGANGRIQTFETGGVEYFASHIKALRAGHPNSLIVSAGDNIGATPLLSALFHDEPTVEALGQAGLQISTVGNHEFDEGWWELYRMQHGGCHPVDGCQDQTPFAGARWTYLAANVVVDPAKVDQAKLKSSGWTRPADGPSTLFPASLVRTIDGVKVGFIGLVVRGVPYLVPPVAVQGLTFRTEVEAANDEVRRLTAQGVHTIIVLIHEGATPATDNYDSCEGVTGPVIDIAKGLSPEVDAVVAGHVHRAYNCTVDGKLVTSGASLGRLITDIELKIDRRTGDVVSKSARNTLVTRDVPKDAAITAIIDHYRPFYEKVGAQVVGSVTRELTRETNEAGEASLGDVVADAFLEAGRKATPGPAVASFLNVGSLRAGLVGSAGASAAAPREVSYAQAFGVLPFNNRLQVRTMTGEAIIRLLEQQFDNPGPGRDAVMQVAGITYRYDRRQPPGRRVVRESLQIDGKPLDPAARYRVISNDFVWAGGDAFTVATEGTDPVDVGADIDGFVEYLRARSPIQPGRLDRITQVP